MTIEEYGDIRRLGQVLGRVFPSLEAPVEVWSKLQMSLMFRQNTVILAAWTVSAHVEFNADHVRFLVPTGEFVDVYHDKVVVDFCGDSDAEAAFVAGLKATKPKPRVANEISLPVKVTITPR